MVQSAQILFIFFKCKENHSNSHCFYFKMFLDHSIAGCLLMMLILHRECICDHKCHLWTWALWNLCDAVIFNSAIHENHCSWQINCMSTSKTGTESRHYSCKEPLKNEQCSARSFSNCNHKNLKNNFIKLQTLGIKPFYLREQQSSAFNYWSLR